MAKKAGVVCLTHKYEKFRWLSGNRDVPEQRIRKIIKSVKSVGQLMSPILVNEKWEIIDGQARYEAFKELGLPIPYIMQPGIGLQECIAMNINQTNWKVADYVHSYAETGDKSYIYLRNCMKAFPEYSINVIANAISRKTTIGGIPAIKKGYFSVDEEAYIGAMDSLGYLRMFGDVFKSVGGKTEAYLMAVLFANTLPQIDRTRLVEKVIANRIKLAPVSNVEQALGMLEDIYNDHCRNKVYLVTEFRKDSDSKASDYQKQYKERRETA